MGPDASPSGERPSGNEIQTLIEEDTLGEKFTTLESDSRGHHPDALGMDSLAAFEAAHARAGIVYLSRIPPAMRPSKVRHLMGGFGAIGRVYLQQEDPKRAHLRRKYTSTKKAHFTEGWVEFMDKRVARTVAEMLNGQPIGGKKGTRFREDVWTLKYLPRFKWNMLTEQIAHESATRSARLRVELSQSRSEQKEYLKNVELARVLAKREERRWAKAPIEHEDRDASLSESAEVAPIREREAATVRLQIPGKKKEQGADTQDTGVIDDVLLGVF